MCVSLCSGVYVAFPLRLSTCTFIINPNTSSNTNTVAPLRHPGSPKGVVVDGSDSTSVRVSWRMLTTIYTVSFSAAETV